MTNGSNCSTSNKPSKEFDVSPKPKQAFNTREVVSAVVILILVVVASILLTLAFGNNYEQDMRSAIAKAEEREGIARQKEEELLESAKKLMEREKEVERREAVVTTREQKLETSTQDLTLREEALATDRETFETEKAEFLASQERVFALTSALSEELAPWVEPIPIEDSGDGENDETSPEPIVYTDSDDPDLSIEVTIE